MPAVMPASARERGLELGADRRDALRVAELGDDRGRLRAEQLLVDGARDAGIGGLGWRLAVPSAARLTARWRRGARGATRAARRAVACAG